MDALCTVEERHREELSPGGVAHDCKGDSQGQVAVVYSGRDA